MATVATAGLLIRVWFEPDDPQRLRARVLTVSDGHEPESLTTEAGDSAVLDAVRTWLQTQRAQQ